MKLTKKQKAGVDRVIAQLRRVPDELFDMEKNGMSDEINHETNMCGSPACIGGHCLALCGIRTWMGTSHAFMQVSSLPHDIAESVCFPRTDDDFVDVNPYCSTRLQAIRLLEILRDTGVVDWEQAMGWQAEEVAK